MMAEKLYKPIVKDNTHLANSKETEGTFRGSLLDDDTNMLAGQAEWVEVEQSSGDEDENKMSSALVLLVGIGIGYVVCKATPHIISWLKTSVVPTAKKTWHKLIKKEYIEKKTTDVIENIPLCVSTFNDALDVYLEKAISNKLDIDTVDKLIYALDDLRENHERNSIVISLSLQQLSTIMDIVLSTTKLIQNNNIISLVDLQPEFTDDSELGELKHQLKIQKHILKQAA